MENAANVESQPHEASLALGIIVLHFVVNVLHGLAHFHFEIPMAMWQKSFIDVVILAAPLAAGVLIWIHRLRAGAWLLLISMTGALIFGVYFHFLLVGPDHISSVGMEGWGLAFLATAFFLASVEAWGVTVAWRLLRTNRRT